MHDEQGFAAEAGKPFLVDFGGREGLAETGGHHDEGPVGTTFHRLEDGIFSADLIRTKGLGNHGKPLFLKRILKDPRQ